MEHDNTYEIDVFPDKSFKVHSAKGSETFDKSWYLGVRGNLHVTNKMTRYAVYDAVQIIPRMPDDTISCVVDNDRKMVICNVKNKITKSKGD